MAMWPVILSVFLSGAALADSTEERAMELNEELEFMMSAAPKPRVWSKGSLPPVDKRSGPAPSQVPGVENLEERFFSDEVNYQAARAVAPQENTDEELESAEFESTERIDGSAPRGLKRKR
jgi:hypothetical protein